MPCAVCDHCPFEGKQDKIIYEIHVTVDNDPSVAIICGIVGSKLIHIEMDGVEETHLMTSDTFKGTEEQAHQQALSLAKVFHSVGVGVHRIKIETVPWHPKAANPSPTQYFEAHFGVDAEHVMYPQLLDEWCERAGLHKSRNLMKKGDTKVQMYTLRKYCDQQLFSALVEWNKAKLELLGAKVDKVITEFALYDSNVEMDAQWLLSRAN